MQVSSLFPPVGELLQGVASCRWRGGILEISCAVFPDICLRNLLNHQITFLFITLSSMHYIANLKSCYLGIPVSPHHSQFYSHLHLLLGRCESGGSPSSVLALLSREEFKQETECIVEMRCLFMKYICA